MGCVDDCRRAVQKQVPFLLLKMAHLYANAYCKDWKTTPWLKRCLARVGLDCTLACVASDALSEYCGVRDLPPDPECAPQRADTTVGYVRQQWTNTIKGQLMVSTMEGETLCLTTLIPDSVYGPQDYNDCVGSGVSTCRLNLAKCENEMTSNNKWEGHANPSASQWTFWKLSASVSRASKSSPIEDGICLTQVGSEIGVRYCDGGEDQQWPH